MRALPHLDAAPPIWCAPMGGAAISWRPSAAECSLQAISQHTVCRRASLHGARTRRRLARGVL